MQNAFTFTSFSKYAFAEILQFRKLSQIWFHMLSQASSKFTNIVLQCWQAFEIHGLARIRKDSQGIANGLLQGFIKDSQVRKSWFFARISNGHFADGQMPGFCHITNNLFPRVVTPIVVTFQSFLPVLLLLLLLLLLLDSAVSGVWAVWAAFPLLLVQQHWLRLAVRPAARGTSR